jgi:chromosome segregation ATPase
MIRDLSDTAQFIITTHRPELAAQADHFYGISAGADKVSKIMTVSKETVYQFLDQGDNRQGDVRG